MLSPPQGLFQAGTNLKKHGGICILIASPQREIWTPPSSSGALIKKKKKKGIYLPETSTWRLSLLVSPPGSLGWKKPIPTQGLTRHPRKDPAPYFSCPVFLMEVAHSGSFRSGPQMGQTGMYSTPPKMMRSLISGRRQWSLQTRGRMNAPHPSPASGPLGNIHSGQCWPLGMKAIWSQNGSWPWEPLGGPQPRGQKG